MRTARVLTLTMGVAMLAALGTPAQGGQAGLPGWAYPKNPVPAPGTPPPVVDMDAVHTVPGSGQSLSLRRIRDFFNIADWHPEGHPPMPDIVARGRRPDVRACGYCHYPNGLGRPENAGLAGLPAAYIVQQMADIKSGARKSADPLMTPPNLMVAVAKAASDEDVRAAAEYFAALPWKPWVKVVETATVARFTVMGGMAVPIAGPGAGTEPLGQRIIELPDDTERAEVLRDDSASFTAYVPMGSVARGAQLAATGGQGKTLACGTCHGPRLEGLGAFPPLAGRSPTYAVRQLFDMQQGHRNGPGAALMKPVVASLTIDDMIDLAAYAASLGPGGGAR